MINGYHKGELSGSGMVVWKGRELLASGEISRDEFMDYATTGYVSIQNLKSQRTLIVKPERRRQGIVIRWERHQP